MKTFEIFKDESEHWDEKWKRMADGAIKILLWCAVNKKTVTYEEMNTYLLKHKYSDVDYKGTSKRYMGHPAGLVGEYMLDLDLPIINSLLVQKHTGIPGNGADHFIGEFLNSSEKEKYEALTNKSKRTFLEDYVWSRIFEYDWESVINKNDIELKSIDPHELLSDLSETNDKSMKSDLSKYKKKLVGKDFSGESNEHKKLKDHVIKNINLIPSLKSKNFRPLDATKEYMLGSADRIDLLFRNEYGVVGVEVKSIISNDEDFYRGIYQCVKYKYLLQAELKEEGKLPFAECILVTQRELPSKLKELAKRLGVKAFLLI